MDAFLIPAAFGLGAFHALEPGHGKTLVTAYLVGNRGRKRDALVLGGIVALSHTASVLALAVLATWLLSSVLESNNDLLRWVEVFSGGLILTVGALMLWRSIASYSAQKEMETIETKEELSPSQTTCSAGHSHGCSHQAFASSLKEEEAASFKEILMLGLASGLCPSPLPLVMLTSAMVAGELHDLPAVVSYLLTFSLGLACVVVLLGLVLIALRNQSFQFFKDKMSKNDGSGFSWSHMPQVVSVLSSFLIIGLGAYLIVQALWGSADTGHAQAHVSSLHHLLPIH